MPRMNGFEACRSEPLFINAVSELLQQAMVNLLSNARDAMPGGGTLRISVRPCDPSASPVGDLPSSDRFVRIAVTDTGCGMSPETLKHVFEPLFTTKKGRGTGLGLAVVHQIVSAHGGYVFAESTPGAGASFSIFLALIEDSLTMTHESQSAAALPAVGPCRVLLVEDDKLVGAGLQAILGDEGVTTELVVTGGAAVAAVERFQPSVVILDVGLPDIDGHEVFRRLRERWPMLPVIFSTGHAHASEGIQRDPNVRLLQKPYELAALLRCIADLTSHAIEPKENRS